MSAAPWTRRIPKRFKKTITFTAAGDGAVGTVTIASVTGGVLITHGGVLCTTLLTGDGILELGTASNTAAIIAQTTGTDIDVDDWWQDASPELRVSPAITNLLISQDIILTVSSATITAGVMDFIFFWLPMTDTGLMA